MVRGVIDERYASYQSVVQQVGAEWGGEQTVIGPMLLIPVTDRWSTLETVQSESGDARQIRREETRDDVVAVLPETLRIDASLDAERRQRGIYEAMVYTVAGDSERTLRVARRRGAGRPDARRALGRCDARGRRLCAGRHPQRRTADDQRRRARRGTRIAARVDAARHALAA